MTLGVSGSTADVLGERVNYIDCSEKRELFPQSARERSVFRFLSFEDELQFSSLRTHSMAAVALDLHPEGRLVGRSPRQIDIIFDASLKYPSASTRGTGLGSANSL